MLKGLLRRLNEMFEDTVKSAGSTHSKEGSGYVVDYKSMHELSEDLDVLSEELEGSSEESSEESSGEESDSKDADSPSIKFKKASRPAGVPLVPVPPVVRPPHILQDECPTRRKLCNHGIVKMINPGRFDYDAARPLLIAASDSGDRMASCYLGLLYEHGLGVKSSLPAALFFYGIANENNALIQLLRGLCHLRGLHLQPLEISIYGYVDTAIELFNESARLSKEQKDVAADWQDTIDFFKRLLEEMEDLSPNLFLAIVSEWGLLMTPKDSEKADIYYAKVAKLAEPRTLFNLGLMCEKQEDYDKAYRWFSLSIERGLDQSECWYHLGTLYQRGLIFKQDEVKSQDCFCKTGYAELEIAVKDDPCSALILRSSWIGVETPPTKLQQKNCDEDYSETAFEITEAVERVRVLRNFKADRDDRLSVLEGEILCVRNRNGPWWHCMNACYLEGMVPANALQLLSNDDKIEGPSMSAKRHPTIAALFDYSKDIRFKSMQRVVLGALWEPSKIDAYNEVPWKDRIKIARHIGEGLHFLHQNKLLHRDLNGETVLLFFSKKSYYVKLFDYGAAILCKEGEIVSNREVGCLEYKAPELLHRVRYAGDNPCYVYNHKTEVYAYAIILWSIAMGLKPYSEFSSEPCYKEKVSEHVLMGKRPEIPQDGNEGTKNTPSFFTELIRNGWRQDAKYRPQITDFIKSLRKETLLIRGEEEGSMTERCSKDPDSSGDKDRGCFSARSPRYSLFPNPVDSSISIPVSKTLSNAP